MAMNTLVKPFKALRKWYFARLYFAQIASLFGDAFTWFCLALLTYEGNDIHHLFALRSCSISFNAEWQVYRLIFALNVSHIQRCDEIFISDSIHLLLSRSYTCRYRPSQRFAL